jgi:beta-aspartyl-peptidase (threonine type)
MKKIALAIHGGAGTIRRSQMTGDLEHEYRAGLENALKAGWNILEKGGTSLDAVEAAVVSLEDHPLFNAGRGSVFTHEGANEMDAAIMDGKTLEAGAVSFVKNIKNPIKLARLVMANSEHVMLAGEGAADFARQMHAEFADDEYFFTEHRYRQLQDAIEQGRIQLDHAASTDGTGPLSDGAVPRRGDTETEPPASTGGFLEEAGTTKQHEITENPRSAIRNPHSKGTVGAVACDANGDLAAATSTGGMTNKKFGRVGDTPIIGAGTYAYNATCAVSCTGHGEYFMRGVTAYDLAARMKYKNLPLEEAAAEAILRLTKIGGEGGLIAVDAMGNIALPFNSEGMYRGFVTWNDAGRVEIYKS